MRRSRHRGHQLGVGTSSNALTKAAFIPQGDAMCSALETQTASIPNGGSEEQFGTFMLDFTETTMSREGDRYLPRMTKLPFAVTAALALFTVVGCGGEESPSNGAAASAAASPATLTKAQYIEKGDAICAKLEADTQKVPAPTDETTGFGAYITSLVTLAEGAQTEFTALKPPADGQTTHKALLDSLAKVIDGAKGAATAANSGDTVTAGDLLTQASQDGDASDAAAKAYGFTKCGSETNAEGSDEAGAGGSDGAAGELTKAEFIAQGDEICGNLEAATEALPEPAGEEDLAPYIGEVVALGQVAFADFSDLVPPADGKQVHDDLVTALGTALQTLNGAQQVAQDGDTVSAGDLLTQASEEGSAADAAARSYGFQICGSEG